ncbi:YlaC family protein [Type-D symbiont of Plautia stali]|uniref:YlaC family protein n=1 Tax=Type-D symbiont of Plautia stali TaxID=1560356 RepID=UPI00073E6779|nr:YlaC family protein [Type-D symbiont of Plautia stali]
MRNQLDDVLQTELDRINVEEQRNDRPYFDISFIKNYPGLFGLMWILFILTMALLMYSDSFGTIEYVVCILIFAVCNFFFFFHVNPSYKARDIDKGAWKNCYTGDWYMEVHVREAFIDTLMASNVLTESEKKRLQEMRIKKGYLYFADIYRLRH